MVDKEMLSAISGLLDEKLEKKLDEKFDQKLKPIFDKLDNVNADVGGLKTRMDSLEADMKYVKEEQLENNVIPRLDSLETGMKYVIPRLDGLEADMKNMMLRLDNLEIDMKIVRVDQLENGIIPRLNTIEEYYIATSERYMESTEQIDEMRMDISILRSSISLQNKKLDKILA